MARLKLSQQRRVQLDSELLPLKGLIPLPPTSGWIAEVRKALLMTAEQLAKRLGVDQSSVLRLEQSEARQKISLDSLNRAADALGCDVRYVLVPRTSLDRQVFEQAKKKLKEEDLSLESTMALEGQATQGNNSLREDLRTALFIQEVGSRIWKEQR